MNFCKKCNKPFEPSKGLKNYCSESCKPRHCETLPESFLTEFRNWGKIGT